MLVYVSVYRMYSYLNQNSFFSIHMQRKQLKQIEIEDNICLRNKFMLDIYAFNEVLEYIVEYICGTLNITCYTIGA